MRSVSCLLLIAVIGCSAVNGAGLRSLKQANANAAVTTSVTVSAANPNINAIAITPIIPYPQTAFYCNLTGDSRFPTVYGSNVFPLVVRVPVGVSSKIIFANITGSIPGTSPGCSSVVQQPGTPGVVQPGTSVVQQPGTSVVQQPGTSVVQQPGTSVVQQPGTSVVQQPGTSVVQQPGTSVVQQPGTSVVQQPGTSVVQQPGTSVVQQPGTSVVQPGTSAVNCTTSVVQQPGTSVVQQPGTSVVQQPGTSVVQQPGTSVVQQPTSNTTSVQQLVNSSGRRLLDTPAAVEFISNNGSMGQPALTILDTVEGVPNIVFAPTAVGQTASFSGALQVAVTTTNDGFGTPYIPYRVDSKLSPNCKVQVNFVAV